MIEKCIISHHNPRKRLIFHKNAFVKVKNLIHNEPPTIWHCVD